MKRFVRSACVAVALMAAAAASAAPPALSPEWVEQKIVAGDGAMGDQFAWTVAFSGDTALVGASFAAVGANARQGVVYVFELAGGVWTQVQKLVADDGVGEDQFGTSIAMSGDTALVSAIGATVDDVPRRGAAYVLTRAGGQWSQSAKLVAPEGGENENFGYSVALDGGTALVGVPFATMDDNAAQGAAYVYTRSAAGWGAPRKLVAGDGAATAFFGWSAALASGRAAVGAIGTTVDGRAFQGGAYLYDYVADRVFASGFEADGG